MTARTEAPELPRPGDLFASRYKIVRLLGRGGFGAVFAATDTSLERDIALKVLTRPPDEEALARFLREARASAAIASEHVATVYEVGTTGDGPYIVMELLRGRDLQDELDDKHSLPVANAVELVLQAGLGIAHAHAAGIVHRDLKPRNLFLATRPDGTSVVKVLDFGIAKSTATDLTQTGATLGTPRYMAPEQLRSARTVDPRTDVWALGVVLYELVSGKPIFDGDTATQLAVSIVIDPHVPLRTRRPDLPAALEAVIDRCLQKEPDDRYADVHQLALALVPFATEAGKALVPRIDRALASRTGATLTTSPPEARNPTSATDATLPAHPAASSTTADASGTAATVATPAMAATLAAPSTAPERPANRGSAPALAHGAVDTAPPPSPRRSRRGPALLALAAAGVLVVVAIVWRSSKPAQPPPDAAPIALADATAVVDVAAPTPDTTPDATAILPAPADAAPPRDAVVDAPADARIATARAPSVAEIEKIDNWCRDVQGPTFLVPNNDGPLPYQCSRLALLGCAGIARACRTVPITDAERIRCRDFLASLKSASICK